MWVRLEVGKWARIGGRPAFLRVRPLFWGSKAQNWDWVYLLLGPPNFGVGGFKEKPDPLLGSWGWRLAEPRPVLGRWRQVERALLAIALNQESWATKKGTKRRPRLVKACLTLQKNPWSLDSTCGRSP